MFRQADDPFVCFGAKTNKGLSPRSRRDRKWVRERERIWTKEPTEGVGDGWREWQSTPESRETSWHEIGSWAVREDRSRWVGIPSSFVEISLEIHASVSLHMHKGMQCYITPLLAIWVNPSLIVRLFVCSLSSHSLDCISCSYEEMCDTPIGITRWSPTKMGNGLKKLTYSGGRVGIVTGSLVSQQKESSSNTIKPVPTPLSWLKIS